MLLYSEDDLLKDSRTDLSHNEYNSLSRKRNRSRCLSEIFWKCSSVLYCIVLYWVTSSLPHARRFNLSMHRSNMEDANTWRKTRIHTWR